MHKKPLEQLTEVFAIYRKGCLQINYPDELIHEACLFLKFYTLEEIAVAIGIPPIFLQKEMLDLMGCPNPTQIRINMVEGSTQIYIAHLFSKGNRLRLKISGQHPTLIDFVHSLRNHAKLKRQLTCERTYSTSWYQGILNMEDLITLILEAK